MPRLRPRSGGGAAIGILVNGAAVLRVRKEGKFHVSLLDKDKKVIPAGDATPAVSGGTCEKSAKLEVTKTEKGFSFPTVKSGEWLIFQFASKELARRRSPLAWSMMPTTFSAPTATDPGIFPKAVLASKGWDG